MTLDQMVETAFERTLKAVRNTEDLAEHLARFLESGCHVWTEANGDKVLLLGRALVNRINGLKIHIYPDEHAPPHFHVVSADIDAAFSIEDCALIRGTVDRKTRNLIEYWHAKAKPTLIDVWNHTRPTDCPVGRIPQP